MLQPKIVVIQGANLAALGTRQPHLYGKQTLQQIHSDLQQRFGQQCNLEFVCSNHEGVLLDAIHKYGSSAQGFVINAGAYTHTSYALADALAAVQLPCIEVHLTNVARREPFRQHSCIAPVCLGSICGLGAMGYTWAVEAMLQHLQCCSTAQSSNRESNRAGSAI
ncbi:MAG: type II 3-dehydroquinate dehydratase [Myxococcota bacterium]